MIKKKLQNKKFDHFSFDFIFIILQSTNRLSVIPFSNPPKE